MKSAFSLLPVLTALSVLPLSAATNLVTNGSFEDASSGAYTTSGSYKEVKPLGTYPYTTGANTTLIDGFTATAIPAGGDYGLVNKNVFSPSLSTTSDTQAAYIADYYSGSTGTLVSNSLGTIMANSTYTLSLNIGAPPTLTSLFNGNYTAGKTAPQVYFALLGNGSAITSQTLANTAVTENGLTAYTLTFTTGASGGYIGDVLTLELQANKMNYASDPGGEAAIFDNVVLTVPEPSAYALMLAAGGLLMFVARRRMMRS